MRTRYLQVLTVCLCLFTVLLLKEQPGAARLTGYSAHLPLACTSTWILDPGPGPAGPRPRPKRAGRASWNGTVTSTTDNARARSQLPAAPLTRCPALRPRSRSLHVVLLVVALRLGHPHCADRVLGGDNLLARLATELENVCDGIAASHWRRGVGGGVGCGMAMWWGEKVREVPTLVQ